MPALLIPVTGPIRELAPGEPQPAKQKLASIRRLPLQASFLWSVMREHQNLARGARSSCPAPGGPAVNSRFDVSMIPEPLP